jgi:beta-N-acetylhexosaminidase
MATGMSLRDLRRQVGQLAIIGFPGHTVPTDVKKLIAAFDLGGVIYFARNVAEPAQVRELSREVASLSRDWPLWISVDQEGGRVARLRRPFTEWPPMMTLGRSKDLELADAFATALGAELRAVGINLDFTPVLDIHTNSQNPVIGDRALGTTADVVSTFGTALIRAFHESGIVACGKHFPGHGDTSVDSHLELPLVEHPPDRLEAIEFVPFRAGIEAGLAAIMTAHVLVPSLDPDLPATLSSKIVQGVLKGALGFGGMVFSDDMGMKALAATRPLPESVVMSLQAGVDVVLLCNSTQDEQVEALEAIIHALETGELSQTRVEDALSRQWSAKTRFADALNAAPAPLSAVGLESHQRISDRMAAWL